MDPKNPLLDPTTPKRSGLLADFWAFLKHRKKWWLLPILVAIGILGLLVFLAGTGLAPFLYPFF